jgi:hypothetical protein
VSGGPYPVDFRPDARAALRARPWTRWADRLPDGHPLRHSVGPVARAALGLEQLGPGEREGRELRLLADWLVRSAQGGPAGRGVAWYTFPSLPAYGVGSLWPSAEGQGLAVSALLRAHEATGEDAYLETARAARPAFAADVAEGGVHRELEGVTAFEGIPAERPALPLGAWAHAVVALRELAARGDPEAGELAAAGVAGLRAFGPRYAADGWFLRSLHPMPGPDLASALDVRRQADVLAFLAAAADAPDLEDAARARRRALRGLGRWRGLSPRARRRDRWVPR